MRVKLLPQRDDGQMKPVKSSQQRFSRGAMRRPFGIARIQPCQAFLLVSQPLAHPELKPRQEAQADGEHEYAPSSASTWAAPLPKKSPYASWPKLPCCDMVAQVRRCRNLCANGTWSDFVLLTRSWCKWVLV